MVYHVSYWDLILAPIYISLFYLIVIAISKKYYNKDEYLRKMILKGFWIKTFFAIIYILITQFYYGGSDGFMYYEFGYAMHKSIINDFSNIKFLISGYEPFYNYVDENTFNYVQDGSGYMYGLSNQIVSRVSCLLGYFCFQNFTIISLFFAMLSYIGVWKMYLIFYKIYPHYKKEITISFLYLPSFLFWGSGLMKEPICLWALGLIFVGFYNLFYFKKSSLGSILGALIGCWLLYFVKSYILFSACGGFFVLGFRFYTKKIPLFPKVLLSLLIFILVIIFVSSFVNAAQNDVSNVIDINDIIEQTTNSKNAYEDMGGAFVNIGDVDPSVLGILKKIPIVILNVFFRPFPWEARSLVMMISMFESLFFIVLFIKALINKKISGFFSTIFKNPVYLSCLVFALFLGIIVGLTTFNFGTIIRYKIPCMPFFCMILLFLNKKTTTATAGIQ